MSKKTLSERAARRCEEATTAPDKCRCRCKGLYHGGHRPDAAMLVDGDPHQFIPPNERKRQKKRRQRNRANTSALPTAESAARSIAALQRVISDPSETEYAREAARNYIRKLREQFPELVGEPQP
jgi:hypothetical protein